MEGLPALELWDLVIDVFRATQEISKLTQACSGKPLASQENSTKIGQVSNVELSNIDQVPSNAHFPEKKSQPYIFEDNEAVIKMIIKARSPTMRHVSRTRRGGVGTKKKTPRDKKKETGQNKQTAVGTKKKTAFGTK